MLVVDDSKLKLLKMNEKLLEVYASERGRDPKITKQFDEYLVKFETMAKEIDEEVIGAYHDEVETANYRNLEYPQQLEKLLELSQEYNDVYELQCGFQNIYEKYTDRKLKLTSLDDILIDDIRTRISNIQGYLVNSRQLEKDKNDLTEFIEKLADCEKKRDNHQGRFLTMENDLKYDFINAEGRKIVDGSQEYTSVIKEYNENNIDLRKMLDDSELLGGLIQQYEETRRATEEKLEAAKICYEKMPDYQEEYQAIVKDMLLARYRLTLLQIAKLIASEKTDYNEMIRKRKELKALNSVREEALKELNIDFLIDPFRRNMIDEQIDVINGYDNQTKEVVALRKKIANLTTVIENRESINTDFIIALNAADSFIKKESPLMKMIDKVNDDRVITDNMVIALRNPNNGFKSTLVKEKTRSVINRVSTIFSNANVGSIQKESTNESDIKTTVPTLVIEEKEPVKERVESKDDNTGDNKYILDNPMKETNIFPDDIKEVDNDTNDIKIAHEMIHMMPDFDSDNSEKANMPTDENGLAHEMIHMMPDFDSDNSEKANILTDENGLAHEMIHMMPDSNNSAKVSKIDDDIFTEVEPFEKVSLFSNKYEGELFETPKAMQPEPMEKTQEKVAAVPETPLVKTQPDDTAVVSKPVPDNKIVPAMPEAFWVTKEDKVEENDNNGPTFDEQIDNLINSGGRKK